MILKSAKVQNYKCIEDSTEFGIDQVTCLVGKNESGKTALLQALYKLNPVHEEQSDFDPLTEYPRRKWSEYKQRHETDADTVVTTWWELEQDDREALAEILGPDAIRESTVAVSRGYANQYKWQVDIDEKEVVRYYLGDVELYQEDSDAVKDAQTIGALVRTLQDRESEYPAKAELLNRLRQQFPEADVDGKVRETLQHRLPKMLYSAVYHRMPGRVSIDDFVAKQQQGQLEEGERVFDALLSLVGTDAEQIRNIRKAEELIAELEAVSSSLTADIFEYWSQNRHLRVSFRYDSALPDDPPPFNRGWVFQTRIWNDRHSVSVGFDERSAGFVWFVSFLVLFSKMRARYGENLVLLLDDPGLSLHARAQEDLLRYIREKLAPMHQVIYTAHSPFMIDPDMLLSVRTVEDVTTDGAVEGTKVGDKALSTDADTVFPLQAALGYDITQTLFVGKHTLLVEGPSELLYLTWFSHQLAARERQRLDPRWTIAPSGGIDKVSSFVTLFAASKLHVAVLTDYHRGVKQKVRSLRESKLLQQGHVFSVERYVDQEEADIEDLLGRSLYISLVTNCYALDETEHLPEARDPSASTRVVKEVEDHFRLLPPERPEFDHYTPAYCLMTNGAELLESLPEMGQALDGFEHLFRDLNNLLPS